METQCHSEDEFCRRVREILRSMKLDPDCYYVAAAFELSAPARDPTTHESLTVGANAALSPSSSLHANTTLTSLSPVVERPEVCLVLSLDTGGNIQAKHTALCEEERRSMEQFRGYFGAALRNAAAAAGSTGSVTTPALPGAPITMPRMPATRRALLQVFVAPDAKSLTAITRRDPAGGERIWIFTSQVATPYALVAQLQRPDRHISILKGAGVDLTLALGELARAGIDRLLVEGSTQLQSELLRQNMVDEIKVYVGASVTDAAADAMVSAWAGTWTPDRLTPTATEDLGNGTRALYYTVVHRASP